MFYGTYLDLQFLTLLLQNSNFVNTKTETTMKSDDNPITQWGTPEGKFSKKDHDFLEKFIFLIENNIASKDLNVEFIERTMKISHSTLYRRVNRLMGMSCRDFLMKMKMENSIKLLEEGRNISEAAYGSGFNDPGYFRHCFMKIYGMVPSQYVKRIRKGERPFLSAHDSDVKLT